MFLFCLVFAISLCASVYMCFVVTCWERADLLALVCGVQYEFVTFPLVSWVRCGTWLYRFLIFAPLFTLYTFFLAFLKFFLILILYKLDYSYIFSLGKVVMQRLKLSIMFATLGQLAAEILVILKVYLFIFRQFLFILMFILIFMYM